MARSFDYRAYPYDRSPDQDAAAPVRHAVVVAGGGMVGLAFAVDMAQRGIPVVVLDDGNQVSIGSRAICISKRSLEIFDRLGIGERCMAKGVTWSKGKVLRGDDLLYEFDLLPEPGHKRPAFINLQQYYVETYLVELLHELEAGEVRWHNRLAGIDDRGDHLALTVETPDGPYELHCDWLIAADGVRSTARDCLGLAFSGETFHDHFLITDVVMKSDFPTERRFWFDPTFHDGDSALLHKQPDDVWRIDLQLGRQVDRAAELGEAAIMPRLRAMLGPDAEFTIDWSSLYTFQCRRLERFRHGRVLFMGDAAHIVSPFGARGGNGGIQDVDNLGWKLAAVLGGAAPDSLLDSYDAERIPAADENILNSTRATDFIAPKNDAMRLFRRAILDLSRDHPFARGFVNSGRLSLPHAYDESPLSTSDRDDFTGVMTPGAPALDAPLGDGWLLDRTLAGFTLLCFGDPGDAIRALPVTVEIADHGQDMIHERYDSRPGTVYLLRPDQHVAARWRSPDRATIEAAMDRALGRRQS
jgi:3-(3-hydroxy-phenyl)propionate hydroxylase